MLNFSVKYFRILILFFTVCFFSMQAQESLETAFSKSYLYEYEAQYSKAIKALLDANTDNYQLDFRLGWLYYLSKDYPKSEAYYRKAIALENNSVEARFGLVLPLSSLGNWNAVLGVYMEVLKLDPNNSLANYRSALIYYNRKDYTNALAYVMRVTKMYPFDYDSNLLQAKIYLALAKSAEAKKYLQKALEYNPQSEEAKTLIKKLDN